MNSSASGMTTRRLELEARAEGAELRVIRRELSVERDHLRADRDRLEVDLQVIVQALGGIAPGEVRPMAEERDSLRSEAEGLRREVERLRGEVERLRGEVERLQGEHASLGDERLALENSALERQRQWEADLADARAEVDRHAAMVRDRGADLATALGERDRLRTERDDTSAEVERLRATVAQLEREQDERARQDRDELEWLRAEVDPLRLEADRLATIVRDRDSDLEVAIRERDRSSAEKETARVEAGRLRMSIHQLERDLLDRGEQDHAQIDRLGSALDQLREENERLRARINRCAAPLPSPGRDAELRAAMARVVSLQGELADLRRLEGEMRGMLAGAGIRFREL